MIPNLFALTVAMIAIESGGNDNALSPDHGAAVGCLQIRQGVLDDVNRFQSLTTFRRSDCFSRSKSLVIFWIYVSHYAKPARLGAEPTARDIALMWHYGPKRARTTQDPGLYWPRVEALIR